MKRIVIAVVVLAWIVSGAGLGPVGAVPAKPAPAKPAPAKTPVKPPEPPKAKRIVPQDARVVLTHGDEFYGDGRVGTYVSSTWGFSTSSYWIEGPTGLILIDTQFLPSAAEEFVNWAESATGKKAQLAIVLHANPDKFNGTAYFKSRGIKVVTSKQVRELIPVVHEKRVRAFYDRYKPDYPKDLTLPESFGEAKTELKAAGLTVTAHVLGAGCSEAHVAVEFEGHLFVGDLVAQGSHSWLEIGRTDEWLKRLEELSALEPEIVHPGRGPSGDIRLLNQQKAYLRQVISAVAAERPAPNKTKTKTQTPPNAQIPQGASDPGPDEKTLERIKNRLTATYFGYRFEVFLNLGLPAEWRRQASLPPGTPALPPTTK